MKQIHVLIMTLLMFPVVLLGQITITAADMPNVGDTLRYSTALPASITGYNFTQTGANHTWNFANLAHASQDVDTFVGVLNTSILYYPSFLGNATIARKGESMNMGTFSLTNVYDFFKEAPGYFSQVGFAGMLSGVPFPTVYSSPDYIYRFPLTFGNTDSCNFAYNLTIPTLFTYSNQSKRVNTVDGWGTLTTPFGTFQTVRVKSVITSRDSIASDSLPFPIPPFTTVTTEYKWLANGYRAPLLTVVMSQQPGPPTVTYMDHYKSTIGIGDQPGQQGISAITAYPNPASQHVVFQGAMFQNGDVYQVSLFDLAGRELYNTTITGESGRLEADLPALPRGVCMARVIATDGTSGTTRLLLQ
jgi:hypothetical protein